MQIDNVLAGIAVSNMGSAVSWYERLMGRPADALPMEGLAEWHTAAGRVQLIDDSARAGSSLLCLQIGDLEKELAGLTERGLDHEPLNTNSDKVLFASVNDLDGNTITLVEPRGVAA